MRTSRKPPRAASVFVLIVPIALLVPFGERAAAGAGRAGAEDYPHGAFEADCADCHRDDPRSPVDPGPSFRHAGGRFPLDGKHAGIACRVCHADLDFTKARGECSACHGDAHAGGRGAACRRCHVATGFSDGAGFLHRHRVTRFPLTGRHAQAACAACHGGGDAKTPFVPSPPVECAACHAGALSRAPRATHPEAPAPADCGSCHVAAGWKAEIAEHPGGRFLLEGAHRETACESCHAGGRLNGTPASCGGCHEADLPRAGHPAPLESGRLPECRACHTPRAWKPVAGDRPAGRTAE